ncbi:NUDIX hydrolase [uncultured Pelagimonas sp.]|uniref:NUDIX hydrolase n=1 Tax=uncultured Pelagimonas sp. TaxID=1618102 RepID=UPI00262E443B|nr:NUDIX hydrolase [uncultured Pelagimonas sp.]
MRGAIANSTNLQGAKIALLCGSEIITYLRDNKPEIPNPGQWDLPGGVREPDETSQTCALRETQEEFGLEIDPDHLIYETSYWAPAAGGLARREVAFFVADIDDETVQHIVFGDEGQYWRMMPIPQFLAHPHAVPELQDCVAAYLKHKNTPVGVT